MSADCNFLLGIVALQNNFVSREQLVEAMNAWILDRQRPLGDILRERKALSAQNHALLEALVNTQLQQHQGDVRKSIQALDPSASISRMLDGLAGEGVVAEFPPTMPLGVGESTGKRITGRPSRFRILRPHARGGLGEVFVAEDLELPREVALKEIQAEKAGSESSRSRFVQEAEITGGLEHPNIVPVYGLGTYPDGRPFYAMRLIRGESLHKAIKRFFATSFDSDSARNLEFRNLLRRFVDVCNAVAYAHSRGILHRDLKPGNIMLGKFGETLVVDWGLAKAIGSDKPEHQEHKDEPNLLPRSGSGYAETVHGSAIGTPSFMSPEQATGRLEELGPASDVYSLGATLYVLLTEKLAFAGKNFEDFREKVVKGDFPRPRAVRKDVPPELDAVVLKAMALRPADRYPTASALGQEVERHLADERVQAYQEPFYARARRWLRKHPGIVSAVTATVLMGIVALGTGLFLVNAEKNRTEQARLKAEENERLAMVEREKAEQSEQLAKVERQKAEQSELSAVKARDQAFQALRSMTDDVVERKLAAGQGTRLSGEDRAFLRGVIRQYDAFASIQREDADSRAIRAEGRFRVGKMRQQLGELKEAEQDYDAAVEIQKQLVAEVPTRLEFRQQLARSHNNRGALLYNTGQWKEAERDWNAALGIYKQLAAEFPTRLEFRQQLAMSHNNRGILLRATGRQKEAEQDYDAALAIGKQLAAEFPTRPEFRQQLARNHISSGNLRSATGRQKEAEQDYDAALVIGKQLAAEFPNQPDLRNELAGTCTNLAILLRKRGDLDSAKQRLLEGRPHHLAALQANPRNPTYHQFYVNHLSELTGVHAGLLEKEEAFRTAKTRSELGWDPPGDAYDSACYLSLCIPIVAKHAKLDDPKRKEHSKFYGDEAMKFLQEAVKRGYKDVPNMKKDTDLDPLRERKDFQALMAELEKKP